jgi:hypothetical protein
MKRGVKFVFESKMRKVCVFSIVLSWIVRLGCLNPVDISGDSGVHSSIIWISTAVTPAGGAHQDSVNNNRTSTVTLIRILSDSKTEDTGYFTILKTHLAGIFSRCGCTQHVVSEKGVTILFGANRVVLDGDVGFQQSL